MNSTGTLASLMAIPSLCNRLHSTANDNTNLCNQLHGPLDDRVAFYANAARSSATRRAYASDMAAFLAWGGDVLPHQRRWRRTFPPPPAWPPLRYGAASRPLLTPTKLSAILTQPNTPWSAKSSGASAGYTVLVWTLPRPST